MVVAVTTTLDPDACNQILLAQPHTIPHCVNIVPEQTKAELEGPQAYTPNFQCWFAKKCSVGA